MSDEKTSPEDYLHCETLQYILDIVKEGTWDWNAKTGHVERSPGWYRMLNYDVGIFPKTVFTWENIIHPDDYPIVMAHFDDYINGRAERYEIEYRCRRADDTFLWIRDQGRIVERNEDGSVARMIGAHLNIHEQKTAQTALQRQNELLSENKFTLEELVKQRTVELEEANCKLKQNLKQIDHLSTHDSLTSLYNRRKSETELQREMKRASRYNTPLSVALFDIDHFKQINDNYGHHIGDEVLKKVSELTLEHIRETDILSRWGGDEFFLVLPGIDISDAVKSIEKIRKLIAGSEFITTGSVTCSFGITQFISDDSMEAMYKRSDMALYRAKESGRNTVMSC